MIIIFGLLTCLPLLLAQLIILFEPKGKKAKDILIGKGEEWRDNSHFKTAYSLALTDWFIFVPIFLMSIIGMIAGRYWGYLFLIISGAIQLYINIFLMFFEREYVYAANGPLKYYTYIWGNFILWGTGSLVYGLIRLSHFYIS